LSKIANFKLTHLHFVPPLGGDPIGISNTFGIKRQSLGYYCAALLKWSYI